MVLKIKKILLFILFFLFSFQAFEQENVQPQAEFEGKLRLPAIEKMQEYQKNSDFNYIENSYQPPLSFWDKVWFYFQLILSNFLFGKGGWQIARYLVLITLIVIIILKLLKIEVRAVFFNNLSVKKINSTLSHINIKNINFQLEIENAISQKKYELAIRFLFLNILKQLADNKLIKWESWKTNRDYYMEIKDIEQKHNFKKLITLYEFVWYGKFGIEEIKFKELYGIFLSFNSNSSTN